MTVSVKKRRSRFVAAVASVLACVLTGSNSFAQSRLVVVNGMRMNDWQIQQLEFFACTPIPNGLYWLNIVSGAWGYVGNGNIQGYFGDQCTVPANSAARQQRKSLSEQGRLFNPGEILSGQNY